MNLTVYNNKGKEKKEKFLVSLKKVNKNDSLVIRAVNSYLANQRQANAHTKKRGEVSGGGVKPWKQKGTGRARQGSIRSPQWKGGGVVFGPRNDRNYKKKLPKKQKKLSSLIVFNEKVNNGEIFIADDFEFENKRYANTIANFVRELKIKGKLLIVHSNLKEIVLGSRNLKNVFAIDAKDLNAYILLNCEKVCILKSAIEGVSKKFDCKFEEKSDVSKKEVEKVVKKEVKEINKKVKKKNN